MIQIWIKMESQIRICINDADLKKLVPRGQRGEMDCNTRTGTQGFLFSTGYQQYYTYFSTVLVSCDSLQSTEE
jgi:hypothetical protein